MDDPGSCDTTATLWVNDKNDANSEMIHVIGGITKSKTEVIGITQTDCL